MCFYRGLFSIIVLKHDISQGYSIFDKVTRRTKCASFWATLYNAHYHLRVGVQSYQRLIKVP